jgi:four helix bundle protein
MGEPSSVAEPESQFPRNLLVSCMNGRFEAYEVALELAEALGPVMATLSRRDVSLTSQMRRATASVALCLAEGARRSGKHRLHLYRIAAGSAAAVRAALSLARIWGWTG